MASFKTGFQYYSVETDRYQDIRIKRLKKECGALGLAVYDYILCEIYRVKGCFLEWDESTAFDVSEYLGLKENQVKEIVNYCCAVGLFSKELLTNERVLTSLAIQSRFTDWSKKAKRTGVKIPEKIKILPEESNIIQEECEEIQEDFDKVKKSKVKERKEKGSAPPKLPEELEIPEPNPPPVAPPPSNGPTLEEVKRFFKRAGGNDLMAERFFNKYDGLGWKLGYSAIVNWTGFANNFIANYLDNEKKNGGKQTTGDSINAVNAATAELIREINEAAGNGGAD